MYLIGVSDFQREYTFPNVNESYSNESENLNLFIDEKVRLLLFNALGYQLFTEFDSYIVDGVLDSSAPTKWQNLVNGVTYTKSGKDYKWDGLLSKMGSYNNSLLIKYVFSEKLRTEQSTLTGVGMVVSSATNSINMTSNYRLVESWNKFIAQYQGIDYRSGRNHIGCNRGALYIDWLGYESDSENISLIRFLRDNKEDYPNPKCKIYPIINLLGL